MDQLIEYSQNLKLLYVEDNDIERETTLLILEDIFDEIIVGRNGKDGLEKFKTNDEIDLVITDINMPELDGLKMTKYIKEINPDMPILVLSAYHEPEYFLDSIQLGVEGYILKPVNIDQLILMLTKTTKKINFEKDAKKSLQLLNQYKEAINASALVSKTDSKGVITYVNQAFCDISEYTSDELIGKQHNFIRHPDMPSSAFKDMWHTIKDKKEIWRGVVRNRAKSGKSYYVKSTVKPILDTQNNILEYIAIRDDVTDIMNPKKLLNDAIKNAKNPIVIYFKLENFDTFEEFYDNETIENFQDRVQVYLETEFHNEYYFEKLYQLGSGEYALTCEKTIFDKDQKAFIKQLQKYQKFIKNHTFDINGLDYNISILISFSYESDRVLESAKIGISRLLNNRHNFIISNNFAQQELENAHKNISTIQMVRKAIESDNVISYFQPIINNQTQEIEKYESLVRLIDEDGKILSPFFFLDIAKKGKYYTQITHIVLKNAFTALKKTPFDISINLSAIDIEHHETRTSFFKCLEVNRDNAHRIVIELLEDESIKEINTIKEFIREVKQYGVKIAIDDFGAGFSNFERLLDYQPDILKIDGCLVRDIETNSYSRSVVKTVVTFAKEQNIQTVAEFVENEEIFNILKTLGVDYSQGHYFGKPDILEG